ncbi:SURF1 family protein [Sphingomonas gei]|uniref:SURF1-like protein n=1 Tax=Sphingomonas gei TaxID=1395960 RepID=A0A4V3QZL8_9SPHN|nr:SURF1 family protein [Sphingomonas gei]TGX54792.1 SURF1 family protein [Sphingomonas gei]
MPRALFVALALLAAIGFAALGVWQVERRAWKLDLIERVDARLHAAPAPLPDPRQWASIDPRDYEYRRVRVTGIFRHDREALVQALTERGAGAWVLTPLRTPEGVVLVNRGFVPQERRDPATRAAGQSAGQATVTGLMRVSEPRGGFLRTNDPAADRWYSRDVAAIARARGLGSVAPFFIDADAAPNPGGYPVGGLTVIQFRNSHLVYALTWFALAALSGAAAVLALRMRRR